MRRRTLLTSAGALAAANIITRARATTVGVTATELKIGHTCPYSGPASAYSALGKSHVAFFKRVNDQGGVGGRKINFITYDDTYTPSKMVEQVRRLVEQDQVACLFNTLGTPTNTAIHKYCNDRKVPQLYVATGADKWGDPQHFPWTIGWQPSYRTEAQIYAKYILAQNPNPKIAVMYQNDDFGKDYLVGLKEVFGANYSKYVVKETSYEVTDATVDSQTVTMKDSGADVLVGVATPKFAAQAIRKAYDIGWHPIQFIDNPAASVGTVMKPAGVEKGKACCRPVSSRIRPIRNLRTTPILNNGWRG
jgi:branched-chain amino acid transport system substrate-binding protein